MNKESLCVYLGGRLISLEHDINSEVLGLIHHTISVCLASLFFASLFYYSAYFYYYSWVLLHFLVLFMDPTILFQLTFTFIYSTFAKFFQFQQNKRIPNRLLVYVVS